MSPLVLASLDPQNTPDGLAEERTAHSILAEPFEKRGMEVRGAWTKPNSPTLAKLAVGTDSEDGCNGESTIMGLRDFVWVIGFNCRRHNDTSAIGWLGSSATDGVS